MHAASAEGRPKPAIPRDMSFHSNASSQSLPAGLANFDSLPDSAHVRLPVVAGLHDISAATVWRWVKSGHLPAPVKLGPGVTAWKVGDLRRAGVA